MAQTHGPVQIRSCSEADALAFRELRLEALRSQPEAFSADYATNEQAPPTFWAERARHTEDDPEQTIFFAVVDATLVGMTGVQRGSSSKTRHSAFLWGVYVQPAWRGQHLADRLIAAAVVWAQRHQVQIVKLGVAMTNIPAIRCYIRCGFTTYGVEPLAICYAGRYYDELLMAKRP